MKKVILLVLGLGMISASCTLFGGSGSRGVYKSQDNGETYAPANAVDPEGSVAGLDTNALIMDRSDTDVLYLGSASGIHRTGNGAESWKHLLAGMRIGDITVDPADPNVLFASGVRGNNGKIVRSADAGVSWQSVRDTGNAIMDIEFVNTGAAYALSQNNGLYYTSDHGLTWTQVPVVLADDSDQGIGGTGITFRQLASTYVFNDMSFDPRNPTVIYLATEKGIIKTSDAGQTWHLLSMPVQNQSLPVSAVTVHPDSSDTVLAAVGSTIFRTTNGGASWQTVKLGTEQRVEFIIVDPNAVNNIYLGLGASN